MALMTVSPNTYVLGGLSAPSTGIAEQFQAGVQANLGRQETRQAMRLREAEDKRREAEARRAQATFEAQQAARAAAQAQRAAQQRAFAEFTRSLREAPTIPEARVRRPVNNSVRTALTPTVENPFPLGGTGAGIDPRFRVPLNVEPLAGPRVGATRGRYRPDAATAADPLAPLYMLQPPASAAGAVPVAAQGPGLTIPPYTLQPAAQGPDVTIPPYTLQPTGQPVRAEFYGVPFDVFPDGRVVQTLTNTEVPATPEYDELRAVLLQQAGMGADLTIPPYTLQPAAQGPDVTIPPYTTQRAAPTAGAPTAGLTIPPYTLQPAAQGPSVTIPPYTLQAGPERAAQDPALTPLERAVQTLVAAGMPREQVQQYIDRGIDLNYLLAQLPTGAPPIPSPAAEEVERINLGSTTGTPLYEQLVSLLPPSSAPSASAEAPAEPPKRTGQDPYITNAGPIAGLTPAGQSDPVAATEAAVRAAPDQDASRYFMDNPNLVLDLQTQMARERQMLEARLRYAEATQNIALYEQTFEALNSRERVVNENMISGQIAIIAAQNDNFGPLQEFLSRARPNDNVQVIPYTDGTVSFFVNGREDGPPTPVADLLEGLAQTFNTEYRDALAAAAELQAEREQFLFENALLQELQTRREISVEQAKALAGLEAEYGKVDPVGDLPSGDKLFQVNVPGQGYVQFRVVEAGEPLVNGEPAAQATIEVVTEGSPLRR